MSEEMEVVGQNKFGSKKNDAAGMPKRGFSPGEPGYRGEPIPYGGIEWYLGELRRDEKRVKVKKFRRGLKEPDAEIKILQKKQQDEQRVSDEVAKDSFAKEQLQSNPELQPEEIDTSYITGELDEEREDYFDDELEKILSRQEMIYDEFLNGIVIGWSHAAPFSQDALSSLDLNDKLNLCNLVGERLVQGFNAPKKSAGR